MSDAVKCSYTKSSFQIWFQNRRQSSRRKTKPLDAIDLEERLSGSSSAPSSPIERYSETGKAIEEESERSRIAKDDARQVVAENKSFDPVEVSVAVAEAQEALRDPSANQHVIADDTKTVESQITTVAASVISSQAPPPSTQQSDISSQDKVFTSMTKPTYLANRRSASFIRQHPEDIPSASQPSAASERAPRLKNSGSYLRLSMSEDGEARVIDRSVPSPPRSQPVVALDDRTVPAPNLRRSYSAAGLNDLFHATTPNTNAGRIKVPRVSQTGRSRDSRAWEFWCDSEARNSLVTKADQENSGKAADAIGLIRQNSKNALRPNSRKANSPIVGQGSFTSMREDGKVRRHGLQRASTTYGRLQDVKACQKEAEEPLSPSGDSDKENWDPDESVLQPDDAAPRRRTTLGSKAGSTGNLGKNRIILRENSQIPSYASSLGGMMESEKKRRTKPAEVDAEVAGFMVAGNDDGDDLDCVQSLLSLSKGHWR